MQRMFTLLDIYLVRTDGIFFSPYSENSTVSLKKLFEMKQAVRVKGQTAVIMSAGQHSRERNFFSITWTRIKGGGVGGGCISCLEINWFHFLSVGAEGELEGYQTGRIPDFFYPQNPKVRQWHKVTKTKQLLVVLGSGLCAPRDNPVWSRQCSNKVEFTELVVDTNFTTNSV